MHATRRLAVGLSLAISLATTSAMAASGALAAVPAAVHTGSFGTWKAAQKAAGFALQHPTWHHGLARGRRINVEACPSGKLDAVVSYGSYKHQLLSLQQLNTAGTCGQSLSGTTRLGTYRIHGVHAILRGICPVPGASCASRNIVLLLTWHTGGVHYLAISRNMVRSAIVRFAGSLSAVG